MNIEKPVIGLLPGDPNGIGPELAAKLLSRPDIQRPMDILLIGDRHVIARGEQEAGVTLDLHPLMNANDRPTGDAIRYLETDTIDESNVTPGKATADGGRSILGQLTTGLDLARAGGIDGLIFCPLNNAALHAAGLGCEDELRWITRYIDHEGDVGEINALEGLWTSRVTSHLPLAEVALRITENSVLRATRLLHRMLQKAGLDRPHICVCGLNPHAGDGGNIGREEIEVIGPAIRKAQSDGIDVEGPVAADTAFVRARAGGIDGIVTMYHDQGQIAMKLLGFERGVTILGGLPYPITTPAHGTAYDIVGRGIASVDATLAAFTTLVPMAHRYKAMAR